MALHRNSQYTRRDFLRHTSATAAAATLAGPALAAVKSPNEKVNLAGIGVGGKGWGDISETSEGHNVVAFCDVDTSGEGRRGGYGGAAEKWPQARRYTDWRKLLDAEAKNLDGVTVSTPDHMHAPITMAAMQLGLATYTQKPLTRTVYEARQIAQAAKKAGVVTQMGNQGHSSIAYRMLVQLVHRGAIGKVKEAHTWSNRPIWPQGIGRPGGSDVIPSSLAWDVWLGVAPERPYIDKAYHPFNWRGWFDFGAGALGDMGCHIIDPVVWGLELGAPTRVWADCPKPNSETFPEWELIHYDFPGTKYTAGDTIRMVWYDGGKLPPAQLAPLPPGEKLDANGSLLIGEKGVLYTKHGGMPRLLPEEKFADYELPQLEEHNHYQQWTNAIRGADKTTSHFDYAGPLTETVLLGTVACRFPGQKLDWDSAGLKFTNFADANQYLHREYRKGWEVKGLA